MCNRNDGREGTRLGFVAKILLLGSLSVLISGCGNGWNLGNVYTLYRTSLVDESRVHVATFDADERESYNSENCEITAELFKSQPDVKSRYWCEKGSFKK
jgi:hypothetical protein